MPHRAARLPACSACGRRWPCRGPCTPRRWRAPSAGGASWPRVPRSRLGGRVPEWMPGVARPAPAAGRPSSDFGRSSGPETPGRDQGRDAAPRAASPVRAPSPLRLGVASGRAPALPLRSSTRPWPGPCRHAGAAGRALACIRRSPRSGPARSPPPPQSGPVAPARTATRAAVSPAPAGALAGPRSARRVGETPAPSHPRAATALGACRDGLSLPESRSRLDGAPEDVLADLPCPERVAP